MIAVCTNKRRPSVQKGSKGSQWWARDPYHIQGAPGTTLCGLDSRDWLVIGELVPDADCCRRCAKKAAMLGETAAVDDRTLHDSETT